MDLTTLLLAALGAGVVYLIYLSIKYKGRAAFTYEMKGVPQLENRSVSEVSAEVGRPSQSRRSRAEARARLENVMNEFWVPVPAEERLGRP
jgi:hypothetical protein